MMTHFMRVFAGFAVSLALSTIPAAAHGPTPQRVDETVAITAPPAAVWAVIKAFDQLGWNPLVTSTVGRGGNGQDAERDVVLKSGGQLTDSLDEYLDKDMSYSYRLAKPDLASFPVSFYSATLTVRPAGEGSEVEWDARFYRADTGNFPAEGQTDEAAIAAMTKLVHEGLQGLKRTVETLR